MKNFFVVLIDGEGVFADEDGTGFLDGGEEPFFGVHVSLGTLDRPGTKEVDGEGVSAVGGDVTKGVGTCKEITGCLPAEDSGFRIKREGGGFAIVGNATTVETGKLPRLLFGEWPGDSVTRNLGSSTGTGSEHEHCQ